MDNPESFPLLLKGIYEEAHFHTALANNCVNLKRAETTHRLAREISLLKIFAASSRLGGMVMR